MSMKAKLLQTFLAVAASSLFARLASGNWKHNFANSTASPSLVPLDQPGARSTKKSQHETLPTGNMPIQSNNHIHTNFSPQILNLCKQQQPPHETKRSNPSLMRTCNQIRSCASILGAMLSTGRKSSVFETDLSTQRQGVNVVNEQCHCQWCFLSLSDTNAF